MLLYPSLAGMCRKVVLPSCRLVIPLFRAVNTDPLTSQTTETLVALLLQLKVAVDPTVALTDVGVLINAAI